MSERPMTLGEAVNELDENIVSLSAYCSELTDKLQQLEQTQNAQRNRAEESARWIVIAFMGYAISSLPIRESPAPGWMATTIFFLAAIATGLSLGKLWRMYD